MSTIAKFRCESITDFGFSKEVKLSAMYAPTGVNVEDRNFTKATPSGTITMRIDNPEASIQFIPEKYYYVRFDECE